ncbi:MAG: DUF3187 family protein [Luminiphilus sp.]
MKALSTSIVRLWGLLIGISPAFASEPLPVLNQSPLAALRAVPAQRSAEVEAGLSWSIAGSIANHFTLRESDSESLFLDGQSDVLSVAFRYGFLEDWDVELTVPWRHHSGGFTDALITDWHKLFSLPNADRDLYPVDDLQYRLSLPGHQREFEEPASGIGDVQISINRRLLVIDGGQLSVGAGAKMSTGKAADWLGSGATDYYALMRFTGQQLNGRPVYWHGQLGATFAGRSELLGEAQKRSLWFAGLAAEWRFSHRWSALLQYDAHSALLSADLAPLSRPTGMFSMALRWRLAPEWWIEFGFSEDAVVESAPDITFLLGARYSPGS